MHHHQHETNNACDRTGVAQFCSGTGIKQVQLRSRTSGPNGPNEYAGAVVRMCADCRKANNGGFKLVRP